MVRGQPIGHAPPSHKEGLDSHLAATARLVEDLRHKTHSLPMVRPDGHSDCGFAEELYAKKEEAERKVIACLPTLHGYLSEIEKQIARCKQNLVVMSAGQTMLNLDDPKREISDAEVAQAADYHRCVEKREQILEAIAQVQEVLAESQSRQYPGGARTRWPGVGNSGSPEGAGARVPGSTGEPSVDEELEHLLAIRPMRGKRSDAAR